MTRPKRGVGVRWGGRQLAGFESHCRHVSGGATSPRPGFLCRPDGKAVAGQSLDGGGSTRKQPKYLRYVFWYVNYKYLYKSLIHIGIWRRGWDSNPRYLAVRLISSQVHSATLPPLRYSTCNFSFNRFRAGLAALHLGDGGLRR